ncbi:hypothetical protein BpHYR1_007138 [Brachionus plicatilis]|uniref:Uncharacterized protein n=1 Tax=Brachionus plicatilis TaxID=10195 RepID=A0A3M7SPN2_BRAPC|nr:hypothetical protein BpHYR1_007138 [Brachionus plicatilis]
MYQFKRNFMLSRKSSPLTGIMILFTEKINKQQKVAVKEKTFTLAFILKSNFFVHFFLFNLQIRHLFLKKIDMGE